MDDNPITTTPQKITPRCYAQKCPTCNGYGTVSYGKLTCVSCRGRGFLIIPVELPKDDGGEDDEQRNNSIQP